MQPIPHWQALLRNICILEKLKVGTSIEFKYFQTELSAKKRICVAEHQNQIKTSLGIIHTVVFWGKQTAIDLRIACVQKQFINGSINIILSELEHSYGGWGILCPLIKRLKTCI